MFGELDHPSDGKTSLKRVSHIVTGLELQEDGTVTGAAEVLETPNGQILKTLFESGAQVGISSRGSGSVQNGVVQEDFKLGTFDFVARPSTPGALPRPSGETKGGATRTEADEAVDKVEVIATDDDSGVRDEIFEKFFAELDKLDTNLCEETSTGDLNAVAEEVITLHNYLTETEITPEIVEEASTQLLTLGGILTEMAANHPEQEDMIADLLEKVELSRGTIIMNVPTENIKEEPMDKQKLEFIKERLNSKDDEVVDEQAQEAAELEELRAKLDELSDEELVEVGLEVGAISKEDLEETDDEEPSEADIQNLFDYVEGLEGQLEEAAEIIEKMAGALEEAEDVGGITLKYEAALGIIQETVSRFQLLQEAVGGEEKANELMESHLTQLEADEETDEVEEAAKDDETDDGSAVVEEILNEDGEQDDAMSEHLRLFEGAKDRLNLTN